MPATKRGALPFLKRKLVLSGVKKATKWSHSDMLLVLQSSMECTKEHEIREMILLPATLRDALQVLTCTFGNVGTLKHEHQRVKLPDLGK